MRWSLILPAFVLVQSALSFVCVALAIPPSLNNLEARARTSAKISSAAYRKNSQGHHYSYTIDGSGRATRKRLTKNERLDHGEELLKLPKIDADHIFEHQMFGSVLGDHGLTFAGLPSTLQEEARNIMNGRKNMAPIPAGINRSKGQLIKYGMRGKVIRPNKGRDAYALVSYAAARATAMRLDRAFKPHYSLGGKTFHAALRNTMNTAKILKPGDPSPQESSKGSSSGSSKGSPRRH
jgi:hypothetical protein